MIGPDYIKIMRILTEMESEYIEKVKTSNYDARTYYLNGAQSLRAAKAKIKQKYEEHIVWLKGNDPLTRATKGYESAIDWIYRRDNSRLLPTLFRKTKVYDKIRNENTVDVFPEWKELFDKYDKNKT